MRLSEINAAGQLKIDPSLIERFTNQGWEILGEGNDQIVLSKPGSNTVLKIVGSGSSARQEGIRRYVKFFRANQRDPHYPRVGPDRELTWKGQKYYAYTQERLQSLPYDEKVLDYLEWTLHGMQSYSTVDERDIPSGITYEEMEGLEQAISKMFEAGFSHMGYDMSNIYNLMQRANGQLVIVDPFSSLDDELDEDAVGDLEQDLREPHSYDAIDHMMQTIARQGGISAKELHNRFVEKHSMAPDDWIKSKIKENFDDGKKILDNDTIQKLNGKISMESWLGLLEAFHADQLTESVDDSTVQAINAIINNFSVQNPRVGRQYIPNMLIGINNKIDVYDSLGHHPSQKNQPMTLTLINGPYFTFVDDDGNEKTYPEKEVRKKLYVRTVLIKDQQTFDKYRTWMKIKHDQSIPTMSESTIDENFADKKIKGKSRPGRVKRAGASCAGSVTDLRARAKKYGGERGKMYHWCANMKAGRTDEVKILSRVKGKGSEPGQLPKFGREIRPGQEQQYLGQQVGKHGKYTIWQDWLGGQLSYHLFDPDDRRVIVTTFGSQYKNNPQSYIIHGLYAAPGNPVKAHEFYHALIKELGLTLISDRKQSPGGNKVWINLERYPDVEIYGYDTRTGETLNFGARDAEMYAVPSSAVKDRDSKYVANNLRLVATAR